MRTDPEYTSVELTFLQQLQGLGWLHLEGDVDVPYLTERDSFHQVLLLDRLRKAVQRINLDEAGQRWLDDSQIDQAVGCLERPAAHKLMEANQSATDLLLRGTPVEGPDGKQHTIRFFDYDHLERNEFLAINQFRVDPPWSTGGRDFIVPDIVLFVNGIPVVVVECKSPTLENPLTEAITQLLRYANHREWVGQPEGAERLFHYNQFMVATCFERACMGTVSATHEHYLEWKDTFPTPMEQVKDELHVEALSGQHMLVAGMLRPAHLLDIVRNFTLFGEVEGHTIKIVPRYPQYRAVHKALQRLQTGQTRREHGEMDQRGGIVWHTQGSGKSLTMVFLVRKMRTLPDLRRFKVVVVTDRRDLEKQLAETAALTGEPLHKTKRVDKLRTLLREPGADLVFGMIQKYQGAEGEEHSRGSYARQPGEPLADSSRLTTRQPVLNDSENILVLVDEAHRSHTSALHANLMQALPNSVRMGFTGTPIMRGAKRKTHEIFGPFIDVYTIQQSQQDGATVPILYEGRSAPGRVTDGQSLDHLCDEMLRTHTAPQRERIKETYASAAAVLEAEKLIAAKARDMLRHYVAHVLPDGFKAQVVAVSRLAAVRYQPALVSAQHELINQLQDLDPALHDADEATLESLDPATRLLAEAYPHLETIRKLQFATVISGSHNDDPSWREWTDEGKQETYIKRFKKALEKDPLAFLIVKSMLLTGFDAPLEQVLYLDRFMQGHELLQAIARVNRTSGSKTHGLVVDYFGVTRHLKEALDEYTDSDVQGALSSIRDELPKLDDRHRRVVQVFTQRGCDLDDTEACVHLLRDARLRSQFVVKLKEFLQSLNAVLPRPEALPYVRDAKRLGLIHNRAANRYRDEQFVLVGAGQKVRALIDSHVEAQGIDPKVPPIDILATEFAANVASQGSMRSQAAEMEHAARYHIRVHFNEDPVYYKKLSQRLEEILERFQDNWDALVTALREYVREVQAGRSADQTGLDPKTQAPFLSLLVDAVAPGGGPSVDLPGLAKATVEMVAHIRLDIARVDFWRNLVAQHQLASWLIQYLDRNNLVPFERQEALADQMVQLARALHSRLVTT